MHCPAFTRLSPCYTMSTPLSHLLPCICGPHPTTPHHPRRSVGCIFAELLGRKPLFPGKDYVHQLNLITRMIGSPSEAELGFITSEKARRYIRSLPRCERTDFRKLWPHANSKVGWTEQAQGRVQGRYQTEWQSCCKLEACSSAAASSCVFTLPWRSPAGVTSHSGAGDNTGTDMLQALALAVSHSPTAGAAL
jgi:hypothetical protein